MPTCLCPPFPLSFSFIYCSGSSALRSWHPSCLPAAGQKASASLSPGKAEACPSVMSPGEVLRSLWAEKLYPTSLDGCLPKSLFCKELRALGQAWPRGRWLWRELGSGSPATDLRGFWWLPSPLTYFTWKVRLTLPSRSYCEQILGKVVSRLLPVGPPGRQRVPLTWILKFIY